MWLYQGDRGLTAEIPRELLDQWARYFAECFDVDVHPSVEQTVEALKHAIINILAFGGLEDNAGRVEKDLGEVRLLLHRGR